MARVASRRLLGSARDLDGLQVLADPFGSYHRREAASVLRDLGAAAIPAVIEAGAGVQGIDPAPLIVCVGRQLDASRPMLESALRSRDADEGRRVFAAVALGTYSPESAEAVGEEMMNEIETALTSPNPFLRRAGLRALAKCPDEEWRAHIASTRLVDSDGSIRKEALEILAEVGGSELLERDIRSSRRFAITRLRCEGRRGRQ